MDQENPILIAFHSAMGIVLVINYTLIIVMWKFYQNKAPGMQTILDQIGRDGLVLLAIALPINWVSCVKIMPNYNYYLALAVVKSTLFSRVILCAQTLVLFVLRYIYVFHFTWISEKSETKMTVVLRILVVALALAITGFEDVSEIFRFRYLMEETLDKKNEYDVPKIAFVFNVIMLIVIVFVQVSIVFYKKKDSTQPSPTEESTSDKYVTKTITFLCFIFLICVSIAFYQIFNFNSGIIQLLQFLYCTVALVIFKSIFINSNEKLLKFCKRTLHFSEGNSYLMSPKQSSRTSHPNVPPNSNPIPPTFSFRQLLDAETFTESAVANAENIYDPNAYVSDDDDDVKSIHNIDFVIQPHLVPSLPLSNLSRHNDMASVDC